MNPAASDTPTTIGKFLVTRKRCGSGDAGRVCLLENESDVRIVDFGGDVWIGRTKDLAYRQTIHGTSGVSRLPAVFGIFRNPKRPTLVQHFRMAIQNNGFRRHSVSTGSRFHRVIDAFRAKRPEDAVAARRATRTSATKPCLDCDPNCFGSSRGLNSPRDNAETVLDFLRARSCYDLILNSGKIVIFDVTLSANKAFRALSHHNLRSAPLWDSKNHRFVGMLTVTDFVVALEKYYDDDANEIREPEDHRIESLRNESIPLVHSAPNESLYDALTKLIENRVHRLPVIDHESGDILYVLTNEAILKFLFLYFGSLSRTDGVKQKLRELDIGTYSRIEKLNENTTLIRALRAFIVHRLSTLPIVDSKGKLVGSLSKFDVMKLVTEKTCPKLNATLKDVTRHDENLFKNAHKCVSDETLYTVIERLVAILY